MVGLTISEPHEPIFWYPEHETSSATYEAFEEMLSKIEPLDVPLFTASNQPPGKPEQQRLFEVDPEPEWKLDEHTKRLGRHWAARTKRELLRRLGKDTK